jgi:hypothetical protein
MILLALALSAALLAFGLWMGINAKSGPQCTMGIGLALIGSVIVAVLALIAGVLVLSHAAQARDLGQWENSETNLWYKRLKMPDNPSISCCGEADSYWCDEIHVRDSKTFCNITDDRDDVPLKRRHVAIGTEIFIPDQKLKWDEGNPTGHSIAFLGFGDTVYCFVQGGGV